MTLKEYIETLTQFITDNPEAADMRVVDAYDDEPTDPEIMREGTKSVVVIAEEF
jgi:hypothetical protein